MIRLVYILLLSLLFSSNSLSQSSSSENGVSQFRPGIMWYYTGINPAKSDKVRKYDRLVFDLTYNDWNGDLEPFQVKPTSIGIGTNLLFDIPINKKNTIALGTGLNHQWTHIRHDEAFYKNQTLKSTEFSLSPSTARSALNFHQLSFPLELRFHNEGWKHFKIHIGGKIGYLFSLHDVIRLDNPKGKTIIKDYNFLDTQHLQYSAHVRVGFRNFALFGEYNLSPLFSNTKSTQLNVLRMGLSISLF